MYFHAIGTLLVLLFSIYWCKEVIGRFDKDLKDLKDPKRKAFRAAIIFYWFITLCILVFSFCIVYSLIAGLMQNFKAL